MKTTTTFTSTISPELIQWIDSVAKAGKRTRRAVLEEAVRNYKREMTRAYLRKGFERIANDSNIIEMAEWGMQDYAKMLDSFDA